MMLQRKRLQGIMAALGILVLIFDSSQALEGSCSGLELCIKTVIPSLFPFFVLSMVLMQNLQIHTSRTVRWLLKILRIPLPAVSVLLPSVLGGYPVGAKCVAELYHQKQINKCDAERLLRFCSNAGPSFLFGMVSSFFPEKKMIWWLWLVHIASAVLTAITIPADKTDQYVPHLPKVYKTNAVMNSAAKSMCLVCCWLILFRMIISFLKKWFLWMIPPWAQVLIMGILELTNGCCELFLISDVRLRFVLCSVMLAFGGICVIFQTASVTEGLSLKGYLKGKVTQTAFSLLISCSVVIKQVFVFNVIILTFVMILRKIQNRCGNLQSVPV